MRIRCQIRPASSSIHLPAKVLTKGFASMLTLGAPEGYWPMLYMYAPTAPGGSGGGSAASSSGGRGGASSCSHMSILITCSSVVV